MGVFYLLWLVGLIFSSYFLCLMLHVGILVID